MRQAGIAVKARDRPAHSPVFVGRCSAEERGRSGTRSMWYRLYTPLGHSTVQQVVRAVRRPQIFSTKVNHHSCIWFSILKSLYDIAATGTAVSIFDMPCSGLVAWDRLIRYTSQDGSEKYGEPELSSAEDDIAALARSGTLSVTVMEGHDPLTVRSTGQKEKIAKLLGPLRISDVPIIRCIGLNYKTHIKETGRALPECPTVFTKPAPAVADHDAPIPVPKLAQEQCDYEGELTVLIGREARDVKAEQALDYVAAYTVGNDVSARDWQREPNKAGVVPQWSFSKSFDRYAPLGPALVSTSILGAADKQELRTWVNGELRQHGSTGDLCHGVRELVAFCSQGQTLQKGSLIMTGTPGGVGLFMKPPNFLKHGDEVVVEISGIGRLRNTFEFL